MTAPRCQSTGSKETSTFCELLWLCSLMIVKMNGMGFGFCAKINGMFLSVWINLNFYTIYSRSFGMFNVIKRKKRTK